MTARRRIVYDELMLMQVGLGISRRMRSGRLTAPVLRIDKLLDERICKRFPFEMTDAQRKSVFEIVRDVQSGRPMNRGTSLAGLFRQHCMGALPSQSFRRG